MICYAENSGLHVFSFLANSILKEVLTAIQKGKPEVFSPGRPKEFLKNYKASLDFLAHLEGTEKVSSLDIPFLLIINLAVYLEMSLLSVFVIEGYYRSRSAVAKFRTEPVYIEFMKQWNIGVYFSLRYSLVADVNVFLHNF